MTKQERFRSERQKTRLVCHSERSEESHALLGQIINKQSKHFHYIARAFPAGILPRPKARSE
jgi:hypothetical protein